MQTFDRTMSAQRKEVCHRAILIALLFGGLLLGSLAASPAMPFLPLLGGAGQPASSPPPTVPAPTPVPSHESGLFPLGDRRTISSAIAVDVAGGHHIAFVASEAASAEPPRRLQRGEQETRR